MIQMYNMDCMEFMEKVPDKHYELAIVDPPYGIGYENGGQYFEKHQGKKWDNNTPDKKYFDELFRISNNQIIFGANYFILPPSRCVISWTKTVELQNRTFSEWEMAWTSFNTCAKWIDLKPFQRNGSRIHPTQKPVALYKWLLKNYANPGDKILDTHGGSGSICISCHDMGFDLDWMELDEDYYKAAVERYERHAAQGELFSIEGGQLV